MITYRLSQFVRGWIYGNFIPSVHKSKDTEVGYLSFEAGYKPAKHYHAKSREISLVISGSMIVNDQTMERGDIFIFDPGEVSDTKFLKDTTILVIKTPSVPGDKHFI